MKQPQQTVAVIGAGPVGLATAAHLIERGFAPLVLEAGDGVAAHFESFRHVQLFSPWRFNMDAAVRRLLLESGWREPVGEALPTAGEMIDAYLRPFAALPRVRDALRLRHRVVSISRAGFDKLKSQGREHAPFVLRTATPEGIRDFSAWAVIDASGTWARPNPLGASGLAADGEEAASRRIAYGMPDIYGRDRARYAGKRVLVVGAGHSAAGDLLALARLADEVPGTRIVWAVRGKNMDRTFGGGANDGLPARGALGQRLRALAEAGRLELHTDFRIAAVREVAGALQVAGHNSAGAERVIDGIDQVIGATGSRPDLSIAAELRLKLDPWIESTEQLAPLIDPNVHSCGSVPPHGHRELAHPEPRYYAVGAKSYGRATNFLMATGYEQVRSVVAALAGDLRAADNVELVLPETGVCSSGPATGGSCCTTGDAPVAKAPVQKALSIPVREAPKQKTSCCG